MQKESIPHPIIEELQIEENKAFYSESSSEKNETFIENPLEMQHSITEQIDVMNVPISKTFERQKTESKPIVKEFMKSLKRHSKRFDIRLS